VYFRAALETIDRFSDTLDLTDFASRIIHPLVRTIDSVPELQYTSMDVLCSLVTQLGQKFSIFIPMVTKVMTRQKISHQKYTTLVSRILKVCTNITKLHCHQNNFRNLFNMHKNFKCWNYVVGYVCCIATFNSILILIDGGNMIESLTCCKLKKWNIKNTTPSEQFQNPILENHRFDLIYCV
jgi:hypothetical protein